MCHLFAPYIHYKDKYADIYSSMHLGVSCSQSYFKLFDGFRIWGSDLDNYFEEEEEEEEAERRDFIDSVLLHYRSFPSPPPSPPPPPTQGFWLWRIFGWLTLAVQSLPFMKIAQKNCSRPESVELHASHVTSLSRMASCSADSWHCWFDSLGPRRIRLIFNQNW